MLASVAWQPNMLWAKQLLRCSLPNSYDRIDDRNGGLVYLVFCWTLIPALFSIFDALCMRELCTGYNNKLAKHLYDNIKTLAIY